MKRKISLFILSCLMAVCLILVSCGESVSEETTTEETTTEETTTEETTTEETTTENLVKDSLGRLVEKPQYGGILYDAVASDPSGFDPYFSSSLRVPENANVNETLFQGDWTKGPTGTGYVTFNSNYYPMPDWEAGALADSWEIVDNTTAIYHIREGVLWQDKSPMNGRELVADDVVWSLNYLFNSPSALQNASAYMIESIEATDKYTVVIKYLPGYFMWVHQMVAQYTPILPRETIELYGNMQDWQNICGTGPFILTDYVPGSIITFSKNPDYWGKDPLHPENSIPYIDGIKRLIIPDYSTRLAALRTGQVDNLALRSTVAWEDVDGLKETNPTLEWQFAPSGGAGGFAANINKEPYNDIRVRQALMMAVDWKSICDSVYGGYAEVLNFPIPNNPEYADAYISLDELPQNLRDLYDYKPDRARELLADAGYAGFKTEILITSSLVDLVSLIQAYWSDIGVEATIDIRERGAYTTTLATKNHQHYIYTYIQPAGPERFGGLSPDAYYNAAMVDDPIINKAVEDVANAYPDKSLQMQILRDTALHIIEQAYVIPAPSAGAFRAWHPWVKGYSGEYFIGSTMHIGIASKYLWLDQDLKTSMVK